MSFYSDMKHAATDLSTYLGTFPRPDWSSWCRIMRMKYGFGHDVLEKMLKEDYPFLKITDDKIADARPDAAAKDAEEKHDIIT